MAWGAEHMSWQQVQGAIAVPGPPRSCHCTYPRAHTAFSGQPAAVSYEQWMLVNHVLPLALAELVHGAQRLDDAWQWMNAST